MYKDSGNDQRNDPAYEIFFRTVSVPYNHKMLHGIRCEPFLNKGRAVQLLRNGSHARIQSGILYKNYGVGQAEALVLFIVCAIVGVTQVYIGKKGEVAA